MDGLRDEIEDASLIDPREIENTKPLKEVTSISIHHDHPVHHVMIGTELAEELRSALVEFLKKNYDIFAWSQGDVPKIDPHIAIHKLFIDPNHPEVQQKE